MNVIGWLWETLPNIQLQGDRTNIVGLLWLVLMAFFTYNVLSQIHPFKSDKKKWIALFNIVASFLIARFIHQYVDNFFMLADLLTGHIDMISHNDPRWSWSVFYVSWTWLIVVSTATMAWFWKFYDLRAHLRFNKLTVATSFVIIVFWTIHLLYYPYDYVVLEGALRLKVYWHSYIPLYFLYGVWYVSIWGPPPQFPLELVKEYYVKGEQYDWVRDPRRLEKVFHQKRARETMKLFNQYSRNSKVLDLGCGTGLITRELHGEVLGIDINEWNLSRAVLNAPNAKFLRGDCENLANIASSSIDTVVFTETLEHLPYPEASLQEIRRILIPGGKLIVSVPSNSFVWRFRSILTSTHPHSEPFHRNFTKDQLRSLLKDFKILELKRIVFGMTLIGVAENAN